MKSLILALSVLASSSALAGDESTLFTCAPTLAPNGLGIERLALDLSNEDPEGVMTITLEGAEKTIVGNVDYEADATRFWEITPSSKSIKDYGVRVNWTKRGWEATVRHDSIDTFSVLACEER